MNYSQLAIQIDNNQLFQPISEIAQQNIRGGCSQGNNDDDELTWDWDLADGTIAIDSSDDDGPDIILYDIADVA